MAGGRAGMVVVSHDREFLAAHRHAGGRARPRPAAARVHDGGYEATWSSARPPAGTPARSTRSTPTRSGTARGPARMQRNWMAEGASATRPRSQGRRQAHQGGQPGVVGEAGGQGQSRPTARSSAWRPWRSRARSGSCGWRSPPPRAPARSPPPLRGAVRARQLRARPGRPGGRLGRPAGDHRRERLGQVDAAGGAARPGSARRGDGWLGPGVQIGEIDQARGRFLGPEQLLDAFGREVARLA